MAASGSMFDSPWKTGAAAIGGGALAAGLGNAFNTPDFKNPASAAQPFLDKIPEALRPYFQHYIDQGKSVDPMLQDQYSKMTSNPSDFLKNLSQGYQKSPGYQFRLDQALAGANNAKAAGGMIGSPANQQVNAGIAEGYANNDYGDWLNHVLGMFEKGQSGLQGESERGFKASTGYGEDLAQALMSQAGLAGLGAAEENKYNQAASNAKGDTFGDIAGIAAKMLHF